VRVAWLLRHVARRFGGSIPPEPLSPMLARARADAAERAAATKRRRVPFPRELVDVIVAGQPVSSDRALREFALRFTPLDEALDRAHAWFVRFRYLNADTTRTRSTHESP
jgi:hypothetical protein